MSKLTNRPDNVNKKKSKLTFYQLPVEIAESPHLSWGAKAIYSFFFTVAKLNNGYLSVKVQTIADRFSASYRQTWRLITELREKGLLHITENKKRYHTFEIPALTGNIFPDAKDLFSGDASRTDTSKKTELTRTDMSKKPPVTRTDMSNNKDIYINKKMREIYKEKLESAYIPEPDEAINQIEKLLSLTWIEKMEIKEMDRLDILIIGYALIEVKKSDYLQSMSLSWIIDRLEDVLKGKYRTYSKNT
jgi:hypothetical protein